MPDRSNVKLLRAGTRRGAAIVLLTMLLPVVLAVAAYSINVVYMELARTELQIATDVATRAAGRVLAVTGNQSQAIAAADRLLKANPFANQTMELSGADIVFGVSTRTSETARYVFGNGSNPNAVQIRSKGNVSVPALFPTMGVPVNYRPIKTAISTQTELDIALVLDRSGSMAFAANEVSANSLPAAAPLGWNWGDPVPPNSRWLDLTAAVETFLGVLESSNLNEHVSLTTYSDKENLDLDLTGELSSISLAVDDYSSRFDGGRTNIGDGILQGAETLSDKKTARPWASRVMIVLTDGNHNTGTDPLYAAQQAASQQIMIYTVTFSEEADVVRMEEVANVGSGTHYHATSATQLSAAFRDIAKSLPTLLTH